jgi:hypothetical protein
LVNINLRRVIMKILDSMRLDEDTNILLIDEKYYEDNTLIAPYTKIQQCDGHDSVALGGHDKAALDIFTSPYTGETFVPESKKNE